MNIRKTNVERSKRIRHKLFGKLVWFYCRSWRNLWPKLSLLELMFTGYPHVDAYLVGSPTSCCSKKIENIGGWSSVGWRASHWRCWSLLLLAGLQLRLLLRLCCFWSPDSSHVDLLTANEKREGRRERGRKKGVGRKRRRGEMREGCRHPWTIAAYCVLTGRVKMREVRHIW